MQLDSILACTEIDLTLVAVRCMVDTPCAELDLTAVAVRCMVRQPFATDSWSNGQMQLHSMLACTEIWVNGSCRSLYGWAASCRSLLNGSSCLLYVSAALCYG